MRTRLLGAMRKINGPLVATSFLAATACAHGAVPEPVEAVPVARQSPEPLSSPESESPQTLDRTELTLEPTEPERFAEDGHPPGRLFFGPATRSNPTFEWRVVQLDAQGQVGEWAWGEPSMGHGIVDTICRWGRIARQGTMRAVGTHSVQTQAETRSLVCQVDGREETVESSCEKVIDDASGAAVASHSSQHGELTVRTRRGRETLRLVCRPTGGQII